jgi:hypothetical protein
MGIVEWRSGRSGWRATTSRHRLAA